MIMKNIVIHNHNPLIYLKIYLNNVTILNIDISNLHNTNSNFSSVNTSTRIIGNKK